MNDVTPDIGTTSPLFSGYQPRAGVFDEMFAAAGQVRPHWSKLATSLEGLGVQELERRWDQAQHQIARDGVTFNPNDSDAEAARPWILDAIPLVLTEAEWNVVSEGLSQRAMLLEMVLADLYGPQVLLKEKVVPPDVLFGHPGFYPAYYELRPPGHRHLLLYAADLARAPSGEWWVTADRTRAPFGLGYALENRIIASRMLPKEFRAANVHRLAPFFVELREALRELAPRFRDNPRIVLWTKGPSSRAYFEDAYLARYLGYTLAEGGDLAVRENRVMLKTLGGLLPVEVLVRRLNDDDCDPVELRPDSASGVSGLLEVMRAGNVSIVNSLGSRLVESPILLSFLPNICRFLLQEELKMPSVATWWCGQPKALKYVLEHLTELVIRSAFRMADSPPIHPSEIRPAELDILRRELQSRPQDYVAQETVKRSTTPVHVNGKTQPWHLAMRAFLMARGQSHVTIPGGLARVSPQSHVLDFTMTSGERAQDVWVLADGAIDDVSLLSPPDKTVALTRGGSDLPSRVADNLFWLGRYVERAESTLRLVRVLVLSISSETEGGPERKLMLRSLAEQGQVDPDYVISGLEETLPNIAAILPDAVFDPTRERSLRRSIDKAAGLASIVRDRIAMDMWRTIRRISSLVQHSPGDHLKETGEFLDRLDNILAELLAFAGLAAESMTRTQGWRFLDLGRRIERAWQSSMLLQSTLNSEEGGQPSVLEALLRVADSLMTYRSRYLSTIQVAPVLDLLVVDDTNPRSIAYQLRTVESHVEELPRDSSRALLSPEQRLAVSLRNAVRLSDPLELARQEGDGNRPALDRLMRRLQDQLPKLSDTVSSRFLTHAGLPRHLASMEGRS